MPARIAWLVMWNDVGTEWWANTNHHDTYDRAFWSELELKWWLVGTHYLIPHDGEVFVCVDNEFHKLGDIVTGTMGCPDV